MSLEGVPKAFWPPIILGAFTLSIIVGWWRVEAAVEKTVDERAVRIAREVINAEFAEQLRREVKEAAREGGRQVVQESVLPLQIRMAEIEGWQRGRMGRLELTSGRAR